MCAFEFDGAPASRTVTPEFGDAPIVTSDRGFRMYALVAATIADRSIEEILAVVEKRVAACKAAK